MASLFKIPRSPFWYLRFKDENGAWTKASTGLRHDDPNQTNEARALRAKYEAKEFSENKTFRHGWDWVPTFIHSVGLSQKSAERYIGSWKWLSMWLEHKKLDVGEVEYSHTYEYLDWRIGRKKRSGKSAGRNTAIMEVKLLSTLLGEAVRLGLIRANPMARLKLKKTPSKKKPELTDTEIIACLRGLESEPEWMRHSFLIALHTGCRLRETRVPLDLVDLEGNPPTMTFPHPKGGQDKAFTIPIPEAIHPLLRELKTQKRLWTVDAFPFQPSRQWQHFFRRVGLPHLCFHCLRVTKITRLRREGVPREVAMRLVNHSSELIHMLYDRHQVADLAAFANSGRVPSLPSAAAAK